MKTIAAAIEFGTSKIVTLLAESGFNRCEIIGSGTVPYAGYMDGEWNEPENLLDAIEASVHAAEVEAKRKIRDIYVGVPSERINVVTAIGEIDITSPDGRVTDEDIDRVMDAAADVLKLDEMGGNVLHRGPAWFSVDGGKRDLKPIGSKKGSKLSALVSFIIADPAFIEDVRNCLAELEITVNAFLSPTMGTAVFLMSYDERDRTPILIDVGYLNTEVSVVENEAITFHAVLPLGGGHLTAALAQALEIGLDEAETIKKQYIFMPDEFDAQKDPEVLFEDGSVITFPRKFVEETIEAEMKDLIEMIRDTIRYAGECVSPRSQIYLTGGGLVNMRGSREYLAEKLERPVKIPAVRATRLNNPRFSSSLGLMDLVFDAVDNQTAIENARSGKLNGFRNIFRR